MPNPLGVLATRVGEEATTSRWQRINARAASPTTRATDVGRWALAAGLAGMAILHVVTPEPFEDMVPAYVPGSPTTWNLLATAGEGLSAVLLARRRTANAGGWVALGTLSGVYLANIDAAVHGGYSAFSGFAGSATAAWMRLPLQWPLQWLAYRIARGDHGT